MISQRLAIITNLNHVLSFIGYIVLAELVRHGTGIDLLNETRP